MSIENDGFRPQEGADFQANLSPREQYVERRVQLESYLLDNPLAVQEIKHEEPKAGGAKVRVSMGRFDVPDNLKREGEPGVIRIAIFVPGTFETDPPAFANQPLEAKLISGLITGRVDNVYVLKAEGLNKQAYLDNSGNGRGQSFVAKDAVKIFKKSVEELKQKYQEQNPGDKAPKVIIDITGYSEGSTQAASIAVAIRESGLGEVGSYTSIGGAGFTGFENQQDANLPGLFKHNLKVKSELSSHPVFTEKGTHVSKVEGEDTLLVNAKVIKGNKRGDGLEGSLGNAKRSKVDMFSDVRNVLFWIDRLVDTEGLALFTKRAKDFKGKGISQEVPWERLQAEFTRNHDIEKLAEYGVPMVVTAGIKDDLFPGEDIRQTVKELRKKGAKIALAIINVGHGFYHESPQGTAALVHSMKEKFKI